MIGALWVTSTLAIVGAEKRIRWMEVVFKPLTTLLFFAVIGRPDEPAAVFHNPAGLVLQHGTHLYASFGLALVDTAQFRQALRNAGFYTQAKERFDKDAWALLTQYASDIA